jgi:imidazolonepropionase-like amidohydrolase
MLLAQVVIVSGERITEVGPAGRILISAGAVVIDLSAATVLPGLIDAHTHMFDTRKPNGTTVAKGLYYDPDPDALYGAPDGLQ